MKGPGGGARRGVSLKGLVVFPTPVPLLWPFLPAGFSDLPSGRRNRGRRRLSQERELAPPRLQGHRDRRRPARPAPPARRGRAGCRATTTGARASLAGREASRFRSMTSKKAAGRSLVKKGAKPTFPAKPSGAAPGKPGPQTDGEEAAPEDDLSHRQESRSSHPMGPSHEAAAALTLQCAFRRILACRERKRRLKQRREYEELMDHLQKEAFVALVKREQAEAERARKKEEEEKKQQREEQQRRKRMLEAAFEGDVEEMKAVLKEVADLDTKNGVGTDEKGKVVRLQHLLNMVDCTDANGNTPLSEASGGGHPEAIRMLIENGGNPNSRGAFNRTPLYRAAFGGHLAAVELLLQHGADPRLYADDGNTPEQDHRSRGAASQGAREMQQGAAAGLRRAQPTDNGARQVPAEADGEQRADAARKGRLPWARPGLSSQGCFLGQAIADAEELVETLRLAAEEAEEKLSLARLKLREQMQEGSPSEIPGLTCFVQELDDVLMKDVGGKMQADGRWPLVIDPSGQAAIFLRYRDTNYLNTATPADMAVEAIRLALLGSLRYGKPLVFDMMELDMFDTVKKQLERLETGLTQALLSKKILGNERYRSLLRPTDGPEYAETEFQVARIEKFRLFVVTKRHHPPEDLLQTLLPVQVLLSGARRKPGFRRPPPLPKWLLPAPCADWEGGAQKAFLLPWQTMKKP
ncbi:IQ motif and ankyrin repeat domain-containing protein 1 isoform X3 [Crotalus tigris]|uniref:IQ motif and ankyrin repeat domain-containing protein 1 isoform X3 n=1 Tax=Crotalus tigris TaxID=88082 RepID=UPI00192F6E7F|nr:IQ motif and ankyrin repeat domain-containing protein 1 isoform X3 [Crotalus tigris]